MRFSDSLVLALSFTALGSAVRAPADANHAIHKRGARLSKVAAERRSSLHKHAKHSAPLQKRASRFLNSNTAPYAVNGTSLPDTDFDIGESYAGLLPISGAANETRELFFWFFPTTNANATDEIAVWFNGGPGCSSLSGLLTGKESTLELEHD